MKRLFFAALVSISGCKQNDAHLPLAAAPIRADDVASCSACHEQIAREWSESMHARAHPSKDPIVAALLELRSKREGPELRFKCAGCHAPRGGTDFDGELAKTGVSCAVCHATLELRDRGLGAERFVPAPGNTLLGPHDLPRDRSPAHQTGPAPEHFAGGAQLCLACHESLNNPKGVSLCATGLEWREGFKETAGCTTCHMPQVDGPATAGIDRKTHAEHRFRGPMRSRLFEDDHAAGAPVDLRGAFAGGGLEVQLTNLTAHAFPTGFPARRAELHLRGFARGQEVWTSSTALEKVYLDEASRPVLAPYAVSLSRDVRLRAGEKRTFTFAVPAGVDRVEIELRSQILAPRLVATLGFHGRREIEDRTIGHLDVKR